MLILVQIIGFHDVPVAEIGVQIGSVPSLVEIISRRSMRSISQRSVRIKSVALS